MEGHQIWAGRHAQGCVESERRRRSEQGAEGVGYPLFHPSGRGRKGDTPFPPLIFLIFRFRGSSFPCILMHLLKLIIQNGPTSFFVYKQAILTWNCMAPSIQNKVHSIR